jgi:hypothetical protein
MLAAHTRIGLSIFLMCLLGSTGRAELVGLWRFDDNASPQPDASGRGHNAEVRNDATWVNDEDRGGVMEFDGDRDYLEVADTDLLSIEGDLTIAAWAKFISFQNWNSIVAKTGSVEMNKPAPYDVYTNNNNSGLVSLFIGNGADSLQNNLSTAAPELETWQHIAVTVTEDGQVTHYLNGELNGEGVVQANAVDNDTNLFIGSRPDFVTNMLGRLDDVAIFNQVLSQDQILTIQAGNFAEFGVGTFLPGDFNGDEVVDIADFTILVEHFNTTGVFANGDIDFNGRIDLRDFIKFRTAFEAGAGGGPASTVPEPGGLAVLGLLCLVVSRRWRRLPTSV